MQTTKQKLIYAVIGILAIAGIAAGTVGILSLVKPNKNASNSNSTQQQPAKSTKEQADDLKGQAILLVHSNPSRAKELFNQALVKYQETKDDNGIADVKAQLDLIDYLNKK